MQTINKLKDKVLKTMGKEDIYHLQKENLTNQLEELKSTLVSKYGWKVEKALLKSKEYRERLKLEKKLRKHLLAKRFVDLIEDGFKDVASCMPKKIGDSWTTHPLNQEELDELRKDVMRVEAQATNPWDRFNGGSSLYLFRKKYVMSQKDKKSVIKRIEGLHPIVNEVEKALWKEREPLDKKREELSEELRELEVMVQGEEAYKEFLKKKQELKASITKLESLNVNGEIAKLKAQLKNL